MSIHFRPSRYDQPFMSDRYVKASKFFSKDPMNYYYSQKKIQRF